MKNINRKILCCSFAAFLISSLSQAQTVVSSEPESIALGGATTTNINAWVSMYNPAAISLVEKSTGAISYQFYPGLSELANKSFSFLRPLKNKGFGFNFQQYGYRLFKSDRLGLAYGMELGDHISAGIEISGSRVSIGNEYGAASTASGSFSIYANLSELLVLGAQVQNLNGGKLDVSSVEAPPTLSKLGLRYQAGKQSAIVAEMHKSNLSPAGFSSGLVLKTSSKADIRIGAGSNPTLLSFGYSIELAGLKLAFAVSHNNLLGFQSAISLTYTQKN